MNFKKLTKEFNQAIKSDDSYQSSIMVEEHIFTQRHGIDAGRNGVSKVLSFERVLTECRELRILTNSKSERIRILLAESTRREHSFGQEKSIYVKLKVNGKYDDFTMQKRSENHFAFERMFDSVDVLSIFKTEYDAFVESNKLDGTIDLETKKQNERSEYELKRLFKGELFKNLLDLLVYYRREFDEKLKLLGGEVVDIFEFSREINVYPEFVEELKNGVEIGYETKQTYNSLPQTIKITRQKNQTKTIKLADIGVEGRDYYSHDDRMAILPEDLEKVKRFQKRFQSKINSRIERAIKKVA